MLNEQLPSRPKRLLSYTIIFLTAVYPLHPAWGAAMTAADKNTQVSQQKNVPIINIATPNGAGVSHNKFQQFSVDKQGAVLNNATTNVNSQIAGQVKANANLKGNAANLIINEVTGSSRSELQGKLEVVGKGANVVIANPNGITCNGCSFVNTPAITLTTGKPILDNKGALSAVEVKKGSVVIGANGMNAQAQTYADIISRATELNGQIKAKNLTLMQGTNRIDFQKGTVTPIAGEGAKPSVSIDTKALGGCMLTKLNWSARRQGWGLTSAMCKLIKMT
ncbi:filamentous hemagglutinin N-terminal domain-containing protein [Providencia huaxiensis]